MPKGIPGSRSHGSGQACKLDRIVPRCEECRAYKREMDRRQARTEGTHAYNRVHGIGAPGEAKREGERRLNRTKGTYKWKAAHGIGVPGMLTRQRARRYSRTAKGVMNDVRHNAKRRKEI